MAAKSTRPKASTINLSGEQDRIERLRKVFVNRGLTSVSASQAVRMALDEFLKVNSKTPSA